MATIHVALKTSAPIGISGTLTGVPAFFFTDPAYTKIGDSSYAVDLATLPIFSLKKLFDYASAGYFTISGGDMTTLTAAQPVKPTTTWGVGAIHDSAVKTSSHDVMDAVGRGGTW